MKNHYWLDRQKHNKSKQSCGVGRNLGTRRPPYDNLNESKYFWFRFQPCLYLQFLPILAPNAVCSSNEMFSYRMM